MRKTAGFTDFMLNVLLRKLLLCRAQFALGSPILPPQIDGTPIDVNTILFLSVASMFLGVGILPLACTDVPYHGLKLFIVRQMCEIGVQACWHRPALISGHHVTMA